MILKSVWLCLVFYFAGVVQNSDSQNPVTEILMLTSGDNSIFKDPFDAFPTVSTETPAYVATETNGIEQKLSTLLENAKFAAVQTDISTEFEIADGLTNYATVNTSEPIPTQLSYNIGTENIENGKDGETLNNTEMQLEESSLITEFENQGVDLYDLSQNNVTSFDIAMLDTDAPGYTTKVSETTNVKVANLGEETVEPQKSNIDKSLDSDDLFGTLGLSTQWDSLINSFSTNLENDTSLTLQQPYAYFNNNIVETSINQSSFPESVTYEEVKLQKTDTNVLKTLTAEADICKCVDCKCTPSNNCHGCTQSAAVTIPAIEINVNAKPPENTGCCTGHCEKSKPKLSRCQTAALEQLQKCCGEEENNNKNGDPCCVVVCLKTINQLKEMLEIASHFTDKNSGVEEFRSVKEATATSAP